MAENQGATAKSYTSPQVNPYGRVDEEVASVAKREEKRKKRTKCLVYLVAFIVFQAVIFLIFGLTIMRVRTPRFRVRSATFDRFDVASLSENPSFNITMITELGVRNSNFGHYRYQNSTVEFFFRGVKVGEAAVPRRRARARSTRKFNVTVELSSATVPLELRVNMFNNGPVIPLESRSRLRGRVEFMRIMRRNRSSNMNCTMEINTSSRQLGNISCR